MTFRVELEQEVDGRWIADVVELPGVLVYGTTPEEATAGTPVLAQRVIADRNAHHE
jgi:predicted RNase H-like HicB family nuclease